MRYWECKCGKLQAFGSDAPPECMECSICGTNAFKNKPENHDFKIRYSEDTGKPKYSMCMVCHERKPILNSDEN